MAKNNIFRLDIKDVIKELNKFYLKKLTWIILLIFLIVFGPVIIIGLYFSNEIVFDPGLFIVEWLRGGVLSIVLVVILHFLTIYREIYNSKITIKHNLFEINLLLNRINDFLILNKNVENINDTDNKCLVISRDWDNCFDKYEMIKNIIKNKNYIKISEIYEELFTEKNNNLLNHILHSLKHMKKEEFKILEFKNILEKSLEKLNNIIGD